MLDPKLQEAIGDLILTYGEDKARALWIETCGFRIDVLIAMAELYKSGIVSVDKLIKSMVLLRNNFTRKGVIGIPSELNLDSIAPLSIYEEMSAMSAAEYRKGEVERVLRRQEAEQYWDDLIIKCDIEVIKEMKKRHSQGMEDLDGN